MKLWSENSAIAEAIDTLAGIAGDECGEHGKTLFAVHAGSDECEAGTFIPLLESLKLHVHWFSTSPGDEQEPCADCDRPVFYCEEYDDYFHVEAVHGLCWLHQKTHEERASAGNDSYDVTTKATNA